LLYSIDFHKKLLEFLSKEHSMCEAGGIFGIAPCTVNMWKQKLAKTGELRDAPRKVGFRKLDPEKLKAYRELLGLAQAEAPKNTASISNFWRGALLCF
jgi:transposase